MLEQFLSPTLMRQFELGCVVLPTLLAISISGDLSQLTGARDDPLSPIETRQIRYTYFIIR